MRHALLAVLAFVTLLVGCTKPTVAFMGKWQLDPKSIKSSDPKVDPEDIRRSGLIVLDFKADKTFVFSSRSGDRDGTFEVDDRTVTMTFTNPKAEADKQPVTGKLTPDGNGMTVTGKGTPLTLKFTKL